MKYVNLALFLSYGKFLERCSYAMLYDSRDATSLMPKDAIDSYLPVFAGWETDCRELGLVASLATVQRLQKLCSEPACKVKDFAELADEFYGRLHDETRLRRCWAFSMEEAEVYEKWWNGWEKIIKRFEEATRDVEEMNKCLAFERYTASMFHALHVAEWGAIKLGEYIGVTDLKKGWGATERKLRELIKAGHSTLPAHLTEKFEFLEQMSREIDSMVLAWRHKVDHAANHLAVVPNSEFTPDIAQHIIGAVRIYMLRLTEGMP